MKLFSQHKTKKNYYTLLIFICLQTLVFGQGVSTEWANSIGSGLIDNATSLAKDHSGNIYIAGHFINTVDFDPGPSTFNVTSNGSNFYVLKLNATGQFLWVKTFGGSLQGYDKSIAVDIDDNVYLTGNYSGTIDFDPSGNTFNLSSINNSADVFILKLDSNGSFVWAKSVGGDSYERGSSIAIDPNQNVCIVGNYADTADFDPGSGVYNLISETNSIGSSYDIYILKLDSAGQFIWAKSVGGDQGDYCNSIAIDTSGNIYTTGSYRETADFNPSSGVNNLSSSWWSEDIFVLKLDSSGNYVWAKSMGGTSSGDEGFSIWIDSHERIYVTGAFKSTADFDPSGGTFNLSTTGSANTFILRLNSNGTLNWAKSLKGGSTNKGRSITTNSAGNVYLTGYYFGSTDFDPASGATHFENSTHNDIYVLKLDSNGIYDWVANIGGLESDLGYAIVIGDNDEIFHAGLFKDTVDFDPAIDTTHLISNGNYDAFVQKLIECKNTGLDVITACGDYTWIDNVTYTSSNSTATHTLTNIQGCDSVITLNLTINSPNTGADTVVACDTYTWIDGITYTMSSDTISDTLVNIAGCDSIVTLSLTILESSGSEDSIIACDSYTWIDGITYTSSNNTATDTLTNVLGCDSVITLNLTINYTTSGVDIITACDSHLWIDGISYTSDNNSATHTIINANGCDSLVTLDLTILSSSSSQAIVTACETYTWINGVTYTSSNSSATHTLTGANGCDSIINLNLTIIDVNESVTVNDSAIVSNATNATYQWLDCVNSYQIIAGETGQSFEPSALGTYAIEVTENGCIDTSECVVIDGFVNLMSTDQDLNHIRYYPNPTSNDLFVELNQNHDFQTIQVLTVDGQLIYSNQVNSEILTLNLPEPVGIYFIQLIDGNHAIKSFKIVKE